MLFWTRKWRSYLEQKSLEFFLERKRRKKKRKNLSTPDFSTRQISFIKLPLKKLQFIYSQLLSIKNHNLVLWFQLRMLHFHPGFSLFSFFLRITHFITGKLTLQSYVINLVGFDYCGVRLDANNNWPTWNVDQIVGSSNWFKSKLGLNWFNYLVKKSKERLA